MSLSLSLSVFLLVVGFLDSRPIWNSWKTNEGIYFTREVTRPAACWRETWAGREDGEWGKVVTRGRGQGEITDVLVLVLALIPSNVAGIKGRDRPFPLTLKRERRRERDKERKKESLNTEKEVLTSHASTLGVKTTTFPLMVYLLILLHLHSLQEQTPLRGSAPASFQTPQLLYMSIFWSMSTIASNSATIPQPH